MRGVGEGTTGATQASVPSKSADHSAWVRSLNLAVSASRIAGRLAGSSRSGEVELEEAYQLGIELRLQRPDAHVLAVGGLVEVVVGRAAVEQAGRARVRCRARARRSVLAIALRWAVPSTIAASTTWPCPLVLGLEEGGEDADDEVGRAAAEVAEQVGREVRARRVLAEAVEGAGDGDVVHVVAGGAGPTGRPGPSRSSGRRPAAGCARGTRRGRARAARWRRAACPRRARRPARPGRARWPPRRGASGRGRRWGGRG